MLELLVLGILILVASELRSRQQLDMLKQLALLNKSPDVFSFKEVNGDKKEEEEVGPFQYESLQDVTPEDLKGAKVRHAQELPKMEEEV